MTQGLGDASDLQEMGFRDKTLRYLLDSISERVETYNTAARQISEAKAILECPVCHRRAGLFGLLWKNIDDIAKQAEPLFDLVSNGAQDDESQAAQWQFRSHSVPEGMQENLKHLRSNADLCRDALAAIKTAKEFVVRYPGKIANTVASQVDSLVACLETHIDGHAIGQSITALDNLTKRVETADATILCLRRNSSNRADPLGALCSNLADDLANDMIVSFETPSFMKRLARKRTIAEAIANAATPAALRGTPAVAELLNLLKTEPEGDLGKRLRDALTEIGDEHVLRDLRPRTIWERALGRRRWAALSIS